MNPLDTYPGVRKALYLILWVVGLILTVWQVGVGVVDGAQQPTALTVGLACFPVFAAYVGYTAQQNVNDTKKGLHNG
jgi:hypothetical protein